MTTMTQGWWITRTTDSGTFARIERHQTKTSGLAAARILAARDPEHIYHLRQETADGGVVFSTDVERITPKRDE